MKLKQLFTGIVTVALGISSCCMVTASAETGTAETGKTLVAYYSASGTTERIADIIAEEMNADIFVITPKDEYTDDDLDWTNQNSRVVQEHNNPDTRHVELVQATPDNFDEYDNVFIGYPIWWGEAAWVVDDFVKENDFTGKNVIPFCTSMSSSLGQSGTKLAEMAGTGNWLEGMRFTAGSSTDIVTEWLSTLNLEKPVSDLAGDANSDGKLDVRDAAYIARMLAQRDTEKLPKNSDFNGDGKVDVRDAAAIARSLAEKH